MDSRALYRTAVPVGSLAWTSRGSATPPVDDVAGFLAHAHDLLVILDHHGRIENVSASAQEILGYSPLEMVGRRVLGYLHPGDRRRAHPTILGIDERGSPSKVDLRLRNRRDEWVPLRWTLSSRHEGRIYAVGRDLSDDLRAAKDAWEREVAELRLRTVTELHDGVLQTLAATSLQLEVARRLIGTDPAAAARVLSALVEGVTAEQRELRFYVDELKGSGAGSGSGPVPLGERVADMLDRIHSIWGVDTDLDTDLTGPFGLELERQILRLIQECVVNSVRHGGSAAVSVCLAQVGQAVHIHISDNGRGFPFLGVYSHEELRDRKLGPLSVKRRVAAGGGRISIGSTTCGAVLSIEMPIGEGRR